MRSYTERSAKLEADNERYYYYCIYIYATITVYTY
jgi:hypothetical protein